jgi:CDP-diacylglycerol--serine O-phosphatidyltransferase
VAVLGLRFVGRLGAADAVTVGNAALGFVAVALAGQPRLAARLVLLAAVLDAVDGIVARRYGGTDAGPYLDSLADVASFCVAPAAVVVAVARPALGPPLSLVAVGVGAVFVAGGVTRLGLYTAYDSDRSETQGVQTTLAATVLAAGVLAGFVTPPVLVGLAAVLAVAMLGRVTYPDLHPQDAGVMGLVQAAAILGRGWVGRGCAYALLFLAVAYLLLAPRWYWS